MRTWFHFDQGMHRRCDDFQSGVTVWDHVCWWWTLWSTQLAFVQDIVDLGAVVAGNDALLQLFGSLKVFIYTIRQSIMKLSM